MSRNERLLRMHSRLLVEPGFKAEDKVVDVKNSESGFLRNLLASMGKMDFNMTSPSRHFNIYELAVVISKLQQLLIRTRDPTIQNQLLVNTPGHSLRRTPRREGQRHQQADRR